jgi:hypothetical protein
MFLYIKNGQNLNEENFAQVKEELVNHTAE